MIAGEAARAAGESVEERTEREASAAVPAGPAEEKEDARRLDGEGKGLSPLTGVVGDDTLPCTVREALRGATFGAGALLLAMVGSCETRPWSVLRRARPACAKVLGKPSVGDCNVGEVGSAAAESERR